MATPTLHSHDVVIDGKGYMLADLGEVKQLSGFTPTFVPRQNVQGDYGDAQQDFWLTSRQSDWRLGEQQKFFRRDLERSRRYWLGSAVDVTNEGQVSLRPAVASLTFAASVFFVAGVSMNDKLYALGSTNLYEVNPSTAEITDRGAHGCTSIAAMCPALGTSVFMGGTNVREWNGSAFSTFSASAVGSAICYHNNTIFGADVANLYRFDSAGTRSTVATWHDGDAGFSFSGLPPVMRSLGGKLLITRSRAGKDGANLWSYDGTGVSLIAQYPANFIGHDLEVLHGMAFVAGYFLEAGGLARPAVYFYKDGATDVLWQSKSTITYSANLPCTITAYQGGLVIGDEAAGAFVYYDPRVGGVSTIGAYTGGAVLARMASSASAVLMARAGTAGYLFPDDTKATTGTVASSLDDFDSSLDKILRGVKVDYDEGSDGDGGSVDISYRLNDLDGAYTSLQTGITSGTEYSPGSTVTFRSISIKVTLNKGTSTNGPVLKRVYIRAVPKQFGFRRDTYVLNLTGRDGDQHVLRRDETDEPRDGLTMANELRSVAGTATPVTITDEFGTYTAVIENDGLELRRVRRGEYLAVLRVREV